jgi:hypothetical protein
MAMASAMRGLPAPVKTKGAPLGAPFAFSSRDVSEWARAQTPTVIDAILFFKSTDDPLRRRLHEAVAKIRTSMG